jgi:hypothetical protein
VQKIKAEFQPFKFRLGGRGVVVLLSKDLDSGRFSGLIKFLFWFFYYWILNNVKMLNIVSRFYFFRSMNKLFRRLVKWF